MKLRRFTLVELLVVMAVIMVLLSVLLPSLKSARETARRIVCAGNVKQLGALSALYASDCNEYMTPAMLPGLVDTWDYWWTQLYRMGYWTATTAAKLDCPVLPKTSAYRPFSTIWPEQFLASGKAEGFTFPRYGRNYWLSCDHSAAGLLVLKVSAVKKRPLSHIMEFTDQEPIWSWAGASVRLNNVTSGLGDLAKSTHRASPNVGFLDGHVEAVPIGGATLGQIDFWWY